jgi:8-oxo-dGTP pyrophosphatase MutT (NUDIX family)
MLKEYSAGLVLFFQQETQREYLILHYTAGHWDFPKGHIEEGENKQQAALRELKEETGLQATILDGFEYSFSYWHHFPKTQELAHKTVYFFTAQALSKEVILSHEHIGFAWLSLQKAYEKLTYDNARELLKKADEFLENR